ncbi:HPP family protein [Gilvimarinus sp. SDUM040013]|uniref:HPP family protein n=1 Tax=Gilvimarinus gilvus TaxID=3058038 RepID=A0ABU4RZ58_9GAMM|nr:HPP family protein [Gilvimarinus sp. SDUM040013]MDO3386616.1 HPP family protein [Gilvimarinus sp. SDUM040013]MDX6849497.1 HPP family protein [Gilvimarinus sp. SDUM040013]
MLSVRTFLGIDENTTSHWEKVISGLGALVGIGMVYHLCHWLLPDVTPWILASMGASAVLLFAVPHGPLSQPWALVGGHLVSAAAGVSCQLWLPSHALTPALAVGMAVLLMSYLRCIHPPGGATALAAVIGGPAIHDLGFTYLLYPIGINVLVIFVAACAFNGLFAWRRYPRSLAALGKARLNMAGASVPTLTHEDFAAAMHELNTFVDVAPDELSDIFARAWSHARAQQGASLTLVKGAYYSNGEVGSQWCVRQIFDADDDLTDDNSKLIYRNVAGTTSEQTQLCRVRDFKQWAHCQVYHSNGHWLRVVPEVKAQRVS